jgi:hypothetical protein
VIGLKVEYGGDNKMKQKRKESMEGDKSRGRRTKVITRVTEQGTVAECTRHCGIPAESQQRQSLLQNSSANMLVTRHWHNKQ